MPYTPEPPAVPQLRLAGVHRRRVPAAGGPIVEDHDYLDDVEELAAAVLVAAHDEDGDPRWTADGGTDLLRAIAELANRLRSYHRDGDGCLDH